MSFPTKPIKPNMLLTSLAITLLFVCFGSKSPGRMSIQSV